MAVAAAAAEMSHESSVPLTRPLTRYPTTDEESRRRVAVVRVLLKLRLFGRTDGFALVRDSNRYGLRSGNIKAPCDFTTSSFSQTGEQMHYDDRMTL